MEPSLRLVTHLSLDLMYGFSVQFSVHSSFFCSSFSSKERPHLTHSWSINSLVSRCSFLYHFSRHCCQLSNFSPSLMQYVVMMSPSSNSVPQTSVHVPSASLPYFSTRSFNRETPSCVTNWCVIDELNVGVRSVQTIVFSAILSIFDFTELDLKSTVSSVFVPKPSST